MLWSTNILFYVCQRASLSNIHIYIYTTGTIDNRIYAGTEYNILPRNGGGTVVVVSSLTLSPMF